MTYLDTALAGEMEKLQMTAAGRNKTLFTVAARLYEFAEAGAVEEGYLTDLLSGRALAIGLGQNEVKATLRSARKAAGRLGQNDRAALLEKVRGERVTPQAPIDPVAPEPCELPGEVWREKAAAFVDWARRRLWRSNDRAALSQLDYLYGRGLNSRSIVSAGLGWNPAPLVRSRAAWGLPEDTERGDRLWLPAGIVIPWEIDGDLWRVSIRRPIEGSGKYYNVPGGANALYNADALKPGQPAALVEGVFDALAIQQATGIAAVASGTTGARKLRWMGRLALCSRVLICFDADPAGAHAASYWASALGKVGRVWRPIMDDPAKMLASGADLRGWIEAGL